MIEINPSLKNLYSGKRVLITGHTGFKGSWLSIWLEELVARVIGYSLDPPTEPNIKRLNLAAHDGMSEKLTRQRMPLWESFLN